MPDRRRKPERTTPHKDKICKTCGRTFEWRKKWERDWDVIKYCSDECRGHKPGSPMLSLRRRFSSYWRSAGGIRRSALRRRPRRWAGWGAAGTGRV
ncbi:DUF2256 domain-containing protein [Tunturiibacter gelidiferens]|uniref:DUF2256 domain-containing protein n=1 Tax=Tunturiibacter gelidiferens TaxID=3069689 RepID=UPI003D9BB97C